MDVVAGGRGNPRVGESDEPGLLLRAATPDDIEGVLALWIEAGAHPTSTDDVAGLVALLARDEDALTVAECDGRLVGTLIATWDGWRGNMYRLAVLPDLRRRAIARRLVEHGEARLRVLGCRRVTALVAESDAGAEDFWRNVDYVDYPMRRYVRNLGEGPW